MLGRVTIDACAKINLGLRVLHRRRDGYHDIITVLQRISLCDRVHLEPLEGRVVYEGPRLTADPEDNLCVRAAEAFRRRFGRRLGVRINLEKVIPVGAGLGGGSSDAAAVLVGMVRLFERNGETTVGLEDRPLMEVAAQVGADVPFFASGLSSALAQGRGEVISPVPGLGRDCGILVLWPGFETSTAKAYRSLDDTLTLKDKDINFSSRDFLAYRGGMPTVGLGNDFERLVFSAHPQLARARDRLLELGAVYAGLTGSGSAIFGVFDDEAAVRTSTSGWRRSWRSFVCRPL